MTHAGNRYRGLFNSYFPEQEILVLWKAGRNTQEIARAVGLPESEVANRLPSILERSRQDKEWGGAD
jgi:DNA-directed RNA polymerase specialized sigma24 family protein